MFFNNVNLSKNFIWSKQLTGVNNKKKINIIVISKSIFFGFKNIDRFNMLRKKYIAIETLENVFIIAIYLLSK